MKTELERYKAALEFVSNRCNLGAETRERVDSILNPPPEMETVTVERWECGCCDFTYKTEPTGKCLHPRENHMDPSETTYIKLTGTYQRPKPQPVERSVSMYKTAAVSWMLNQHPQTIGKTGTLTFTWQD